MVKIEELEVGDYIHCIKDHYIMEEYKDLLYKNDIVVLDRNSKSWTKSDFKKRRLERWNSMYFDWYKNIKKQAEFKERYFNCHYVYTDEYPELYKECFIQFSNNKYKHFDVSLFEKKLKKIYTNTYKKRKYFFRKGKSYKVVDKFFNSEVVVESELRYGNDEPIIQKVSISKKGFKSLRLLINFSDDILSKFINQKEKRKLSLQKLSDINFNNFFKRVKNKN